MAQGMSFGRESVVPACFSAIKPNVFHTPSVVLAVHHEREPLDLGHQAGRRPAMKDDRPSPILLQLFVDLPNQQAAAFLVGHD